MPDLDCDLISILEMVQGGDCSPPSITTDSAVRCGGAGETGSGSSEEKKGRRDRAGRQRFKALVVAGGLAGMAA